MHPGWKRLLIERILHPDFYAFVLMLILVIGALCVEW